MFSGIMFDVNELKDKVLNNYKVTKEVGCAIIGQTSDLALADKRFYSVRDVTATIESVPLIAASILSKKLSAGIEGLVMDLKCGSGAFMNNIEDARSLAKTMVKTAAGTGLSARALITNMSAVLGKNVGNALEVIEAISYLKGEYRDPRMNEIVMTLCGEALQLKGLAKTREDAMAKLQQALDSGKAAEKFAQMVSCLGGPADLIENPEKHMPKAPIIRPVYAEESGYVSAMDVRKIGETVIVLGGQRKTPDQQIDFAVGFTDFVQIGEKTDANTPIAMIHANSEETFAEAEKMYPAGNRDFITPQIYRTSKEKAYEMMTLNQGPYQAKKEYAVTLENMERERDNEQRSVQRKIEQDRRAIRQKDEQARNAVDKATGPFRRAAEGLERVNQTGRRMENAVNQTQRTVNRIRNGGRGN